MRLSASMLDTWMSCPLKAKFQYVDDLPRKTGSKQIYGIYIHQALEIYNRTHDIEKALAHFLEKWDQSYPEIDVWNRNTSFEGLRVMGIETLENHHETFDWTSHIVLAQEHSFLVPMGKHQLRGIVDLVEVRKSGRGKNVVRIVDYKTASRRPTKEQLYWNQQGTIYYYASMQPQFWLGNEEDLEKFPPIAPNAEELWETYQPPFPRRPIWFHLKDGREIDMGPRDEQDFMRLYRAANEIEKAWDAGIFVPNISAESCTFCDFKAPCGVRIPEEEVDMRKDESFE